MPAYNIMHEEGRVEVAAFYSDVRDCVMDDLNGPCSLLQTSVWLFVKFSWTVSLDQCDNARTHVISSQSNLNEGVIYSLTTLPHPTQGHWILLGSFFSICSRLSYKTEISELNGLWREDCLGWLWWHQSSFVRSICGIHLGKNCQKKRLFLSFMQL